MIRTRPGFSLIEILIALTLASTLFIVIMRSSEDMLQAVSRASDRMMLLRQEIMGMALLRADIMAMVAPGAAVGQIKLSESQDTNTQGYPAQLRCVIEHDDEQLRYASWIVYHDLRARADADMPVRVIYRYSDGTLTRATYPIATRLETLLATEQKAPGMVVCTGVTTCKCVALELTHNSSTDGSADSSESRYESHLKWPLVIESAAEIKPENTENKQAPAPAVQAHPEPAKNKTIELPEIPGAIDWTIKLSNEHAEHTTKIVQMTSCARLPLRKPPTPPAQQKKAAPTPTPPLPPGGRPAGPGGRPSGPVAPGGLPNMRPRPSPGVPTPPFQPRNPFGG